MGSTPAFPCSSAHAHCLLCLAGAQRTALAGGQTAAQRKAPPHRRHVPARGRIVPPPPASAARHCRCTHPLPHALPLPRAAPHAASPLRYPTRSHHPQRFRILPSSVMQGVFRAELPITAAARGARRGMRVRGREALRAAQSCSNHAPAQLAILACAGRSFVLFFCASQVVLCVPERPSLCGSAPTTAAAYPAPCAPDIIRLGTGAC